MLEVKRAECSVIGKQIGENNMSEQNKMIARRLVEEVESRGNLAVVDELVASDFVNHTPFGEMHGVESAKQFVSMLRRGFPDLYVTVEDQIAEGDCVATRWMARGTHEGEFQGVPPTGRPMEITGIFINRIANGKIIEQWATPDLLGLMQQIGAVPVPGQG
jgi:steroid delta-isomerase-like uncharacterized protein